MIQEKKHSEMTDIIVEEHRNLPVSRQRIEYVERKGLGHPDTICDLLMESVSIALSRAYLTTAGRVLHHNIDKGLLVAGQSKPAPGGGSIHTPMRVIFGDRATAEWEGQRIPIGDIVQTTAREWIDQNLRFVDPEKHVVFQNEIRPGSPELVDIFARGTIVANDTSAAVGYAPLTPTERLVLAAEQRLNSAEFKAEFPEAGEDVKVMGIRNDDNVQLTVAVAFIDRFIRDQNHYFQRKAAIRDALTAYLNDARENLADSIDRIGVEINTLDEPERGIGGMYLTVLGTSADGADGGQVGRGNRVNGVISLNHPMSTEAAAGKNPVSHVGKIYNTLSHRMAHDIESSLEAVEQVYVWLCSQIGRPLRHPWSVSVDLILADGAILSDVEPSVNKIIETHLADIESFCAQLARGDIPIC